MAGCLPPLCVSSLCKRKRSWSVPNSWSWLKELVGIIAIRIIGMEYWIQLTHIIISLICNLHGVGHKRPSVIVHISECSAHIIHKDVQKSDQRSHIKMPGFPTYSSTVRSAQLWWALATSAATFYTMPDASVFLLFFGTQYRFLRIF